MYTYCRFWNAKKALLLYPGDYTENKFKSYLTDDYSKHENDEVSHVDHQCKIGFVSVLDACGRLDEFIGTAILKLMND